MRLFYGSQGTRLRFCVIVYLTIFHFIFHFISSLTTKGSLFFQTTKITKLKFSLKALYIIKLIFLFEVNICK